MVKDESEEYDVEKNLFDKWDLYEKELWGRENVSEFKESIKGLGNIDAILFLLERFRNRLNKYMTLLDSGLKEAKSKCIWRKDGVKKRK